MWEGLSIPLSGSLVLLEPLAERHREGLWSAAKDPEIWTWLPVDASRSRETFEAWFAEALNDAAAGLQAPYATIRRSDGHVAGSTRFMSLAPEHRRLEIGWTWLARSEWGSGLNVEAKLLMLEHAFERLRCLRVELLTDANNSRSRAAIAALPAQLEGVLRKHRLVRDGRRRDTAIYSITDEEWPEVRASLRRRLT